MNAKRPQPVLRYLLGVSLTVAYLGVQSQEPSPSAGKSGEKPQAQTTQSQQDSATEQRGTDNLVTRARASTTQEQPSRQEREREEKTTNERWLTYSTVWLAAVTTILAIFTGYLWLATRRLVEGAQDTARKQLRAYVNISSARISFKDSWPTVHLEFKNFGQTPAKQIVVWCDSSVGDLKWQFARTLKHTASAQNCEYGVMGPTAAHTMHAMITPLSPDAVGNMQEGKKAFYFWGRLSYIDVFDQPQTTWFRSVIMGREWLTNTDLGVCRQGNDAT